MMTTMHCNVYLLSAETFTLLTGCGFSSNPLPEDSTGSTRTFVQPLMEYVLLSEH